MSKLSHGFMVKVTDGDPTKLPALSVQYCYNRAVVSFRGDRGAEAQGHIDVFFGPWFYFRLGRATKKVARKLERYLANCQCRTCVAYNIKNCKKNLGCNACNPPTPREWKVSRYI